MNLFPENIRNLMLPCKIEIEKPEENKNNYIVINNNVHSLELNEEIISGSTCCENKKIEDVNKADTSKKHILYISIFLNNLLIYFIYLFEFLNYQKIRDFEEKQKLC